MSTNLERVVIVSGLSGAGRSTALHALEDLGYFCVDNIPTKVVAQLLAECRAAGMRQVALGIDVRLRVFLDYFSTMIGELRADQHVQVSVVFLDASDAALLARFSATRRPHPLSSGSAGEYQVPAVLDGIQAERERLATVRATATHVIDSTALTVHDLRRAVVQLFGPGEGKTLRTHVRVVSFGFKYGLPVDADVVLDVRFLRNPYFDPELRHLTGLEDRVLKYVMADGEAEKFLRLAHELTAFCVPLYEREGKAYLTIAIGCTGGQHRSVAMAVQLAQRLQATVHVPITVSHRDISRDSSSERTTETDIIGGGVRGMGQEPG